MPIGDLASVCILSYNRPEFLQEAIQSARDNAGYRHELIVNDDGSTDPAVIDGLNILLGERKISRLNRQPPGHNQGVGESVRTAFASAQGDVLVKYDQDCIAEPGWLAKLVDILFNVVDDNGTIREVGMVGAFHYADTADERFRTIQQFDGWQEVTDFVGSVFAIRRDLYDLMGGIPTHSDAFAEDVELKERLRAAGYIIALPDEDLVHNRGFGVGPSTVVSGYDEETQQYTVQGIHHSSILFD